MLRDSAIQWLVVALFLVLACTSLALVALARYQARRERALGGNVISLAEARRQRA
jgi:hypothetical protein